MLIDYVVFFSLLARFRSWHAYELSHLILAPFFFQYHTSWQVFFLSFMELKLKENLTETKKYVNAKTSFIGHK